LKRTISVFPILIILGIFLLSVLVRVPNINRPLSKHHEFVTAVSLRVLDIWSTEGAMKYGFNPVMNYPGEANKNINNWASTTGEMIDKEGNYYYVSHPPLAYILPHIFFKILHVKPSVLSLQIFHLLVNLICAIFIYLIVCLLGQQKPFARTYWSGMVGVSIYIFSQGVLWFQCNTYMSDMLVQLFFVLNVYTILKLLMRKRFFSPKYLVHYAFLLFLMIYTSWLGIFFAFSVFLYSFIKLRKTKVYIPINLITLFVTIAAVSLFVFQYSQIAGFDNYLDQMLNRVSERGGLADVNGLSNKLKQIPLGLIHVLKGYFTSYLPLFLLLGSFIYLTLSKAKLRIVFTKNGYRFLWLSTLPVVLLHVFLLNYSGHDFVSLYGSLFLSVLIAILFDKLKKSQTLSSFQLRLGIAFVIFTSIASYYYINRPGSISLKGDQYAQSKLLGESIKEQAEPNAVIFIQGNISVDPQLIYYAKRNILKVSSKEEAVHFLQAHDIQKGQLYRYDVHLPNEFSQIFEIQTDSY
tara:strand:+ start:6490 stop:8052 length:1563 start_codon:yes stop_codon:yes gene_type:complete